MKTGLFFGTFNPIHNGHLQIANYMANETDLDEVWLVVSPQNPLKQNDELLSDKHRLAMVKLAAKQHKNLKASDVEFHLPKPSYTFLTLQDLLHIHPEREFVLIIGEDNLRSFHKWKNYDQILSQFEIYVYPRKKQENESSKPFDYSLQSNVKLFDVLLLEISSSEIREAIGRGGDVTKYFPFEVDHYIQERGFYRIL
ncbi:MAG: nicotinic acid mononucleotide adenylyltransferase [Flavobacteriales bacterium]|nr:MAG: nicotinic acid mononucleotide adenylyltransferase [Flavobacteriales bacterium]